MIFGLVKLLYVLLAVVGFILWKKLRRPANTKTKRSFDNKMVACEVCQVHIPEREAILYKEKAYCSEEHLKQKG